MSKQITLRLEEDMHVVLKKLAETERRSLHAEILVLVQEALETRGEIESPKRNRHPTDNERAA